MRQPGLSSTCFRCGVGIPAHELGALPTVGGVHERCLGCDRSAHYPVGGLDSLHRPVAEPLAGTPFAICGLSLGDAGRGPEPCQRDPLQCDT